MTSRFLLYGPIAVFGLGLTASPFGEDESKHPQNIKVEDNLFVRNKRKLGSEFTGSNDNVAIPVPPPPPAAPSSFDDGNAIEFGDNWPNDVWDLPDLDSSHAENTQKEHANQLKKQKLAPSASASAKDPPRVWIGEIAKMGGGSSYKGEFIVKDDMQIPHGFGTKTYPDNDKHHIKTIEGKFENGVPVLKTKIKYQI